MIRLIIISLSILTIASCGEAKIDEYVLSDELKEKAQATKQKALESKQAGNPGNIDNPVNLQADPKSVAEEVFKAARTGHFSVLSQLCDPNGEVDRDSQRLCAVESTSEGAQADFMAYFKSGKVIGDPVINGDQASVQIKFGMDGDRDETLNMVKRGDKWYLSSF